MYRDKNGKLVPYLDIVFPKLSLERIVIGKHLELETTIKVINILLQQTDYQNIDIVQSKY